MSNRFFVVDTSYLLELFKVGKDWDELAHETIKHKFITEEEADSRFYFPIPVLFEFANHIADANNKRQASKYFMELIDKCQDKEIPYFITPCSDAESIEEFIQDLLNTINRFNTEFMQEKLGLTDASTITEAERLAIKYKNCQVHIWTRHNALKAREPAEELNPFV